MQARPLGRVLARLRRGEAGGEDLGAQEARPADLEDVVEAQRGARGQPGVAAVLAEQDRAEVVDLAAELVERELGARTLRLADQTLAERDVVAGVVGGRGRDHAGIGDLVEERPHALVEEEAGRGPGAAVGREQRLVAQRLDDVERRRGVVVELEHGLGRLDRERAAERGALDDRVALGVVEQVPRRGDRGAQAGVARRHPAGGAAEDVDALLEALGQLGRAEQAEAGRGQLEREREAVEAGGQRRQRVAVAVRVDVGAGLAGAVDEQGDRGVLVEGVELDRDLAVDAERLARGREERGPGRGGQPRGDLGRGRVEDLLEVVDHEQEVVAGGEGAAQDRGRVVGRGPGRQRHARGPRRRPTGRPRESGPRTGRRTRPRRRSAGRGRGRARGPGGSCRRRPGRAGSPVGRRRRRCSPDLVELGAPPDQRAGRRAQVGARHRQGADRGNARVATRRGRSWNRCSGRDQALEPVLAQVPDLGVEAVDAGRGERRPADQDLPAVPGPGDPCGPVDHRPVVVHPPGQRVGPALGLADVDAHADAQPPEDRPVAGVGDRRLGALEQGLRPGRVEQGELGRQAPGHPGRGAWERDHEGVALGLDLVAAEIRRRGADHGVVQRQRLAHQRRPVLPQRGRPLHVGEGQGDHAGWGVHAPFGITADGRCGEGSW